MKNRYDNALRVNNQLINSLGSPLGVLWRVAAYELKRAGKDAATILEIGAGEGDSALPLLELTDARMHLLDVSPEMTAVARRMLKKYRKRLTFIVQDAYEYLRTCEPYAVMYSSFTVHNFKRADKKKLFEAVYGKLAPGGLFVLVDLVASERDSELLQAQLRRYQYLPQPLRGKIVAHVKQDASPAYLMKDGELRAALKDAGFKKIKFVDRIEREVLILATK